MSFELDELMAGIEYWRGTKWPQDFHNDHYGHRAEIRNEALFLEKWWSLNSKRESSE